MKTYMQYTLSALLVLMVASGCKKTEFMPPPEGEKVEYIDPKYTTLDETLKASPHKLFLKVFQRSNMDSVLTGKSGYTLLAPTDAAMQAAGYTETVIAAMTPQEADALAAFLTLRGRFTKEELQLKSGNLVGVSLQARKDLKTSPFYYGDGSPRTVYDYYYYRHFILISGDRFLLNGVQAGEAKDALPARNGYVFPVNKVPAVPIDKSFKQYLLNDPRFSMFMEVQRKADSVFDIRYRKTVEDAVEYDPGGYGWVDSRRTDYDLYYEIKPDQGEDFSTVQMHTMFAPTNEAFHKAGFQTVDDVMAWNEKYFIQPVFDWNTWNCFPFGLMSDSILAYHWDYGRDNLVFSSRWGKAPRPLTDLFFANDLNNSYLSDFIINHEPGEYTYHIPFSFGTGADGKPTMKIKGSNAPEATVTETIYTIMGPIHVVDRLLIPNNYKLN